MGEIRQALRADRDEVVAILVEGFFADEFFQWVLGGADYSSHLARWMQLAFDCAIERGGAFVRSDGTGAALWAPPDTHFFDEAAGEAIARIVGAAQGDRTETVFGALLEIDAFHEDDLHAGYLHAIAVVPPAQGRGIGTTLLDHMLRRYDDDGVAAFLEASSPRSAALYERHGYVALAEVQLPDGGPVVRPMLRPASS